MNRGMINTLFVAAVAFGAVGCSESPNEAKPTAVEAKPAKSYVVDAEPAGALAVGDARESATDDAEIVVVGRIGGSEQPFVDGLAAFTIVDPKVPHCAAEENCPTPWDYCCEQNLVKDNIATIKIVDEAGKPVAQDAKKLLGVKELSMVVVRGKAKRDEEGNLSVLADQVFLKN